MTSADSPGSAPAVADASVACREADRLREAGQWQQAADLAFAVVAASPGHAEAWALLALILPNLRRLDEAERAARRSIELAPQDPLALRASALVRLHRQDVAGAATLAEQAHAQAPGCARTLTVLAAVRLAQARLDEAATLLDRAGAIGPLAEIDANRALVAIRRGRQAEAVRHAERAVASKPHLANVWRMLGSLHMGLGHDDRAIGALEQVVKLEPLDAAVMADLGELYRRAGRLPEALATLARAVAVAPDAPAAWTNYAIALQEAGRDLDALDAYAKSAVLAPSQETVHLGMARLHTRLGRLHDASASYLKALEIRPDLSTRRALSAVQLRLGKTQEALEFIGRDTGFVRFAADGRFTIVVE